MIAGGVTPPAIFSSKQHLHRRFFFCDVTLLLVDESNTAQ
jgi:hypothetical protein